MISDLTEEEEEEREEEEKRQFADMELMLFVHFPSPDIWKTLIMKEIICRDL